MIIDKEKHYRTRDGREVRIYAVGQASPFNVHGAVGAKDFWWPKSWTDGGEAVGLNETFSDGLVEADPHGILPRHRELLAEAYEGLSDGVTHFNGSGLVSGEFYSLAPLARAALIALARLEKEKGE